MSRGEQRTKGLFSATNVAGNSKKVFSLRGGLTGAAIQVVIVEDCLCVSTVLDECVSLACNSYTDTAHGFETGLKGTFAAVVGCAECQAHTAWTISGDCCNIATVTEACHSLTTGERGIFTTSACAPAGLCACGVYFVIDVSTSTYRLAATRALALSGCSIAVTDVGCGTHTFSPNGEIPAGSTANSFIIKVDDCTFKLATSKALAQAGTVDPITALNAPASMTFTATVTANDCANGTITFHAGNGSGCFAAANLESISYNLNGNGVVNTVHEFDPVTFNEIQIDVCVTEGQWILDIDYVGKQS